MSHLTGIASSPLVLSCSVLVFRRRVSQQFLCVVALQCRLSLGRAVQTDGPFGKGKASSRDAEALPLHPPHHAKLPSNTAALVPRSNEGQIKALCRDLNLLKENHTALASALITQRLSCGFAPLL